jgi:hypothetical protein
VSCGGGVRGSQSIFADGAYVDVEGEPTFWLVYSRRALACFQGKGSLVLKLLGGTLANDS